MLRRIAVTVAALAVAVTAMPGAALAMFGATGSGSARLGATTISNASGLTSACVVKAGADNVKLSWTVSPDSAFVSYVITRTGTNGAPSGTINAAGTAVTATDVNSFTNTAGYTLTYTIKAVVGTAPWTTAVSSSTTRTFTKSGTCS